MNSSTSHRYRYYAKSSSSHSLKAFIKHLPQIGTPTKVEGLYHGKSVWFEVIITGTKGKLVLRGCSWGYRGEGPRATETVLKALGVHPFDVDHICFNGPRMGMDTPPASMKPVWRINLPATFAQLARGESVSRLSPEQLESQRQFAAEFAKGLEIELAALVRPQVARQEARAI